MTDQQLLELAHRILTERQLRTYQLHARGLSQYTIALTLHISRSTVRGHLREADRKLQAATKETT